MALTTIYCENGWLRYVGEAEVNGALRGCEMDGVLEVGRGVCVGWKGVVVWWLWRGGIVLLWGFSFERV